METQTKSTSPFQNTTERKTEDNPQQFSFQTMQDDLLNLQKAEQAATTTKVQEQIAPSIPSQKPFNPKDISSTEVNPFIAPQRTSISGRDAVKNTITIKKELPRNTTSKFAIIITTIILLTISLIGLGIYYFQLTQTPKQVAEIIPATPKGPTQPITETPVEKYSQTKPNYLTIDLANLPSAEIQLAISSVANEIKTMPLASPYEFIIVDANNNPVAFPIFATAAKLSLSPAVLSSLGENFSLFIYNDNGNSRIGLSAAISKLDTLATELQKQEATFPTDASLLLLDAISEIQSGTFTTTNYDVYPIHYLNLNQQKDLSVDYTITDSQLIISTSKNTQRAVLSKIKPKITSPGSVPGVTTTITPNSTTDVLMADVIDKFKTCDPASYSDNTYYRYSIIGKQSNLCAVKISALKNINAPELEGKEMICLWDNVAKTYEEAMAGIFGDSCTGPLKDAFLQSMNKPNKPNPTF